MGRHLRITVLVGAGLLLSAVAVAASAASAPTAITGPVTALGTTTATVTGTVNPGGLTTSRYFEYGTTTSYGSTTASVGIGSGTANVAVSAALTGLAPGTTYHYRVVATNSTGTSRGADGIFATPAAPGVVTGAATSVTPTSATLSGTVDPNSRPTTWFFEYGTSTSYGSKTPEKSAGSGTSAGSVSAGLSGLARGKLYHFRLVATSDAGLSRGADRTFSTIGAPAVVTRAATSVAPTSARLNGTVTPNGQATSWLFEYGTTSSHGSKTSAGGAGSGTGPVKVSRSLTRLKPGTTYHFRLVATNASGTIVGSDRTFTTIGSPVVLTGAVQGVGPNWATAVGSVNPLGRATTWYVEYGTSTSYGSKTATKSAGSGLVTRNVSFSLAGLTPATTYHYRLVAKSDAGTSRGADVTFTTVGVTLAAAARRVVYGRAVTLSGTVPTARPGEVVTVFAQAFDEPSLTSVATVLTTDGGAWRYLAKPRVGTTYRARWNGGLSQAATIGVRPAVSFRRTARRTFATHVFGARSFASRVVQFQRLTSTKRWVTVKRVRLKASSAATFRASLPRGRSVLRIAMSVNQAGRGYLAGYSRVIVYRR
ncbi:MAG TPA: hypothetical protein VF232_04310 [Gaiellaceae bacterium]